MVFCEGHGDLISHQPPRFEMHFAFYTCEGSRPTAQRLFRQVTSLETNLFKLQMVSDKWSSGSRIWNSFIQCRYCYLTNVQTCLCVTHWCNSFSNSDFGSWFESLGLIGLRIENLYISISDVRRFTKFAACCFPCQDSNATAIGVQIEFDETGQQLQVKENLVGTLATLQVMVANLKLQPLAHFHPW